MTPEQREKERARAAAYRAKNAEKEKARKAAYRAKHPEIIKANHARWWLQTRAANNFFQLSEATARLAQLVA